MDKEYTDMKAQEMIQNSNVKKELLVIIDQAIREGYNVSVDQVIKRIKARA